MSSAWTHSPQLTGLREALAAQLGQVLRPSRSRPWPTGSGSASPSGWRRGSPTAAGSRTWRRRRCWWRSCRGRRRRPRRRRPGRAGSASCAGGRGRAARSSALGGGRTRASPAAGGGGGLTGRPPRAWRARACRRARARRRRSGRTAGPSKGCLSMTSSASPGRDPALAEVAQHLGVGVRDAHEHAGVAGLELLQRGGRRLVDAPVAGGDRVAVRVVGRVAELGRDHVLEVLGEHVLEHLGLVVDAVPGHVRATRPGRARAGGGGAAPRARPSRRRRSARRRGSARA